MESIARRAGLSVSYVYGHNYTDLIEMVKRREADVIPHLAISDDRNREIDYTEPLETTPASLFVRAANKTVTGLSSGITVGVVRASAVQDTLGKRQDIRLKVYDEFNAGIFDLLAGRVDAFAGTESRIWTLAREAGVDDKLKIVEVIAEMKRAFAVRKGNTQLLARLNRAIEGFTGSREYQEIYVRWYGKPKPLWSSRGTITFMSVLLAITVIGMSLWRYRTALALNRELRDQMRERQRAEEEMDQSRKFLQTLIDTLPVAVFVKSCRDTYPGHFVLWNKTCEKIFGLTFEQVRGRTDLDIFPREQAEASAGTDRKCLDTRSMEDIPEEPVDSRVLGRRILHTIKAPLYAADGSTPFVLGISEDITEQRRTEAFIQNILQSVNDGFLVIDPEFRVISANRALCEMVGLPSDEIIGMRCHEVNHNRPRPCFESGEDCPAKRTLETGEPSVAMHLHQTARGYAAYWELKAHPMRDAAGRIVSVIETVVDVSEKKRLENELLQAQKMEAVGQLAGGIAHDFNNMLTAIMGYGNLLHMKTDIDSPLRPYIEQILTSAERSADLTRQLLAFSRKQIISPKQTDINTLISGLEKLLVRVIGEDIEFRTVLHDGQLPAMVDPGQIEQVLMNLCTNARDAMPHGGLLAISTGLAYLDQEYVRVNSVEAPGRYGLIAVTDTGMGMDEKTVQRIFEPFFTTKETGRGTGLGLAIIYGIIKQHRGHIAVYSEPGKGSTFSIYLPLSDAPPDVSVPAAAMEPPRGTETVLIAEDSVEVRSITRQVLEGHGYSVMEATDGEDAIDMFRQYGDRIDLVILDVIMPKKSGREVYDELKIMRPDIDVLFTSGYTADIIHKKGILDTDLNFISKPVTPHSLLTKVRDVLDGMEGTAG